MWKEETVKHHAVPAGIFPFSTRADAICTGLRDVLVTGLLTLDYAPLVHKRPDDYGPTVVFRFTNGNKDARNAYHFVQPTLRCKGRLGVVCIQRAGTLTVFRATEFAHTSTINEVGPDPENPCLGVATVQKTRSLNISEQRSDVLKDMISFPILERYHKRSDTEVPTL